MLPTHTTSSTVLGRPRAVCFDGIHSRSQLRATHFFHAAPASSNSGIARTRAAGSRDLTVEEETVDAIAVLERPGSIASTQFEEHDLAWQVCEQLQALNQSMEDAITETDHVLELSQWTGLTIPTPVQKDFLDKYRANRKEERRARKAMREQQKAMREQQQAGRQAAEAAAAPAPAAFVAPEQPPAIQQQQQQPQPIQPDQASFAQMGSAPAERRPARSKAQQHASVLQPLAQPVQQQQPRQRRRRSSAAVGVTQPAVVDDVGGSSSSVEAAAPATANRGGPAGPRPAAAAAAAAPAAAAAAAAAAPSVSTIKRTSTIATAAAAAASASAALSSSSGSGGSGSSSALVSPSASSSQPASRGFAPLQLQPGSTALPVRASPAAVASSRRSQRSAGLSRRGSAAAGAAVAPAPLQSGKLADNTLHGLDMRAELLTADQEKELALMVQDLLTLENLAKELTVQLGRTPSDAEWMSAAGVAPEEGVSAEDTSKDFARRLHAGRMAKQAMISANYKLVVSICRKYQGHGMSIGDLINEGIAGLVKGVERFQPAKGFKFSTYAHWWIRQSVSRSLSEQGRLVRLPSHLQELMGKLTKVTRAFEAQHGREPDLDELASELGVDPSRIKDAYEAVVTPRSLDQPMGGDSDGATLGDVMEDDRTLGPEDAVYIESLKQDLEGVLTQLSERDAGVLRMRFGLLDGREYTLDDVGAKYKVTRERIRQIEAKAIRQLRSRQLHPGSVMADYQLGGMADKQLASRTSSGTKKQS